MAARSSSKYELRVNTADFVVGQKFSTDFSQKGTKHSSTIALPWQQGMPMRLVCVQNESL